MTKKVIYTCITGNYDALPRHKPGPCCDFICFLDAETIDRNRSLIENTTEVEFREAPVAGSPQEVNRILKIRPHEFLSEYDESFYIDGNIRLHSNPFPLADEVPEAKPVALYLQPDRDCAFREIDELVRVGIAKGTDAKRLKSGMRALGMKSGYGLFEANIIFRRHNDPACIVLMEIWWNLWVSAIVKRDQPYLAFANHLTAGSCIHTFGYSGLRKGENPFFFYEGRLTTKGRLSRLRRRIASELTLYRRG